jgi:hypothetical protein
MHVSVMNYNNNLPCSARAREETEILSSFKFKSVAAMDCLFNLSIIRSSTVNYIKSIEVENTNTIL